MLLSKSGLLAAISCRGWIKGMRPYLSKSCTHSNSQIHTYIMPEVKCHLPDNRLNVYLGSAINAVRSILESVFLCLFVAGIVSVYLEQFGV